MVGGYIGRWMDEWVGRYVRPVRRYLDLHVGG